MLLVSQFCSTRLWRCQGAALARLLLTLSSLCNNAAARCFLRSLWSRQSQARCGGSILTKRRETPTLPASPGYLMDASLPRSQHVSSPSHNLGRSPPILPFMHMLPSNTSMHVPLECMSRTGISGRAAVCALESFAGKVGVHSFQVLVFCLLAAVLVFHGAARGSVTAAPAFDAHPPVDRSIPGN